MLSTEGQVVIRLTDGQKSYVNITRMLRRNKKIDGHYRRHVCLFQIDEIPVCRTGFYSL